LKHGSEVKTETSIPRQHVQKRFVVTARYRLFTQQRKTRFSDNRKNEEVYRSTEGFISGRREANLGREN
jgi:hypothetical protein